MSQRPGQFFEMTKKQRKAEKKFRLMYFVRSWGGKKSGF